MRVIPSLKLASDTLFIVQNFKIRANIVINAVFFSLSFQRFKKLAKNSPVYQSKKIGNMALYHESLEIPFFNLGKQLQTMVGSRGLCTFS